MDNTEVEVGLVFNDTSEVPSSDDIVKTLVDAVNSPNNTFNISVVPGSIRVPVVCK